MLIRKLEKKDAAELKRCRLRALCESPDAFLVTHGEVSDTPLAALEAELVDDDICYVGAFVDGALAGFMRLVRFPRLARRHVAEVRSVHVSAAYRGQGMGAGLLHRLIELARQAGIRSLILAVLADNVAARRLYESCGFRLYGVEPCAVRKGDGYIDQALYALDLAAG